eukprot:9825037-Alexandrium_andersonii.AAC.1
MAEGVRDRRGGRMGCGGRCHLRPDRVHLALVVLGTGLIADEPLPALGLCVARRRARGGLEASRCGAEYLGRLRGERHLDVA